MRNRNTAATDSNDAYDGSSNSSSLTNNFGHGDNGDDAGTMERPIIIEDSVDDNIIEIISTSTVNTTASASTTSSNRETTKRKWTATFSRHGNNEDNNEEDNSNNNEPSFARGDHVYSWCSFLGVPWAYQHHGIVVDVDEACGFVTIVDFHCVWNSNNETKKEGGNGTNDTDANGIGNKTHGSGSFALGRKSLQSSFGSDSGIGAYKGKGILSTYMVEESIARTNWHRVRYGATVWETMSQRSGSCSSVQSDPVGLVLARVDMLLQNPDLLPSYHVMKSNCECVAFWCKTGVFSSLQAASVFRSGSGGLAGTAAIMGTRAAAAAAEIPAAGLMGWMGYTTAVPLTASVPWLMPAIAAYGITSTVVPVVALKRCEKEWIETTNTLNFVLTQYNLRGMFLAHSPMYNSKTNHESVRV